MSTIKNDQISLHCHFNKIIKEPGTSFQSPALRQKYVRKCFSYSTLVFDKISFQQSLGFKGNKHKCKYYCEVGIIIAINLLLKLAVSSIQHLKSNRE